MALDSPMVVLKEEDFPVAEIVVREQRERFPKKQRFSGQGKIEVLHEKDHSVSIETDREIQPKRRPAVKKVKLVTTESGRRKKEGLNIPFAGKVLQSIHEKLRMKDESITQKLIAEKCGLRESDLSRYFNGAPMKMSEVETVSRCLGATLASVIEQAFVMVKIEAEKKYPDYKETIEVIASGVSRIGKRRPSK